MHGCTHAFMAYVVVFYCKVLWPRVLTGSLQSMYEFFLLKAESFCLFVDLHFRWSMRKFIRKRLRVGSNETVSCQDLWQTFEAANSVWTAENSFRGQTKVSYEKEGFFGEFFIVLHDYMAS